MITKKQFVDAIAGGGFSNMLNFMEESSASDDELEGQKISLNETMGEGPADWIFSPIKVRRLFKSMYL